MSSLPLDRAQAVATIRRALAGATEQLAEGLVRLLRDSPPHRIERLMQTPARRLVLEGIFWQLLQHVDRGRAASMSSSVRWHITGRPDGESDLYELQFEDGRCRVIHGAGGSEPRLTITVDGAELLLIATGRSDPIRAYFKGRLALAGDVMVAAKLVSLLRIPGLGR